LTVELAFAGVLVALLAVATAMLFCRYLTARREARRLAGDLLVNSATLATVPGAFVAWLRDGSEQVSPGLAKVLMASDGDVVLAGFAGLIEQFGVGDRETLAALVGGLRARGEEFSTTLLTIDAGHAIRLDGRRARHAEIDIVWVTDVTSETALQSDTAIQLTATQIERDALKAMLDALPFPVWRRSKDLSLSQLNRAYIAAIDDDVDGDSGRPPELGELESGAGRALAARAQATGRAQSESRHIVVGGERRLYEFTELPTPRFGLAGFALDVTQIEDVQEELANHIAANADVLENVAVAIAVYGPDMRLKFYNTAYARLWDADTDWLDSEPTLGDELEVLRDRRMVTEEVDFRAFKQEQLNAFTSLIAPTETLVHLPDGKTLRKRMAPHPLGGLLFMFEDVTDRLTLERQYNTLIEVQRRTLDNLYEGVALIGPDGRLKLCNAAFRRLWQYEESDLQGEPHVSALVDRSRHFYDPGLDWADLRKTVMGRMTAREPVSGTLERVDGSMLEYAGVPLPDGMMLMTYIDVSDRNRVERALRERNEALQDADRLKSEFVANVSYELRTPLNTIIGFAEVLSGDMFGRLNDKQADYIAGILQSSEILLELINDILDLATIEAGYMKLDPHEFDVHAMMAGVYAMNRERARQSDQRIELACATDIGTVVADERRLKQVLFNLVSNAITFTPHGGSIRLMATRDGGDLVLQVSDTGVGIPPEEHDRVLEKFERGSRPRIRQSGVGAGLGLSLVKSFIELHGGSVRIESAPEAGTTIICRIPASPAGSAPLDAAAD
jgi:signal transduction histidine kinase